MKRAKRLSLTIFTTFQKLPRQGSKGSLDVSALKHDPQPAEAQVSTRSCSQRKDWSDFFVDEALDEPSQIQPVSTTPTVVGEARKASTLDEVLQSAAVAQAFEEHLEMEMSSESLGFLKMVADFRRKYPTMSIAARRARVRLIYVLFINSESSNAINISSAQRDTLKQQCNCHRPFGESVGIDVFDEAAKEIRRLLEHDSIPRFVRTASFRKSSSFVAALLKENDP
jgi:hypothetical protein